MGSAEIMTKVVSINLRAFLTIFREMRDRLATKSSGWVMVDEIVTHHHPIGDFTLSFATPRITRDIQQAGKPLKIEVLEHIALGNQKLLSIKQSRKL